MAVSTLFRTLRTVTTRRVKCEIKSVSLKFEIKCSMSWILTDEFKVAARSFTTRPPSFANGAGCISEEHRPTNAVHFSSLV